MLTKPLRNSYSWALDVMDSMLAVSIVTIGCVLASATESAPQSEQPMQSPQDAVATFQLPEDFEIRLVAAEPDLVNPVSMAIDEQGRIYVSLAHTYRYGPEGAPVDPPANPVVRLEPDAESHVARRVVVATGFENPIMGLTVRNNRLWATHLNEVFVAQLDEQGKAVSLQTIVRDSTTPWNPFGMYRIEFGPDGWLTLSVGDHPISLTGLTNRVAVRGKTGGLFRFRPDGSDIQLLVQGVRAPFSFDIDPFGHEWLISNGEGNPNRLIQVIPGGDYHFQTRSVDWDWLAGKHPLAPPVWENPAGAHTAVLAYRSDAFPEAYWGNILVSNWGVHGFPSANHVIIRHQIDPYGNCLRSEPFLTTTDPHFRPTQICHAPDGNIYLLDWYGRDDENDLTGRLYKIVYVGNRKPSTPTVASAQIANRNHFAREQTRRKLLQAGPAASEVLKEHITSTDPLAAAEALWTLVQCDWPMAATLMRMGLEHADWRVRRLAVQLLGEGGLRADEQLRLLDDDVPAVTVETAMAMSLPADRLAALMASLRRGAAKFPRLRYRAALEVARHGSASNLDSLLNDPDVDVRLAGLIALDEAFHEGSDEAVRVLARRIDAPGQVALLELLAIGERWPDEALVAPVIRQLNRDVSVPQFARGLAILHRLEIPVTSEALGQAVERLLGHVGVDGLAMSKVDKMNVLSIITIDTLAPSAFSIVASLARDADVEVRAAAHRVLVAGAIRDHRFVTLCWEIVGDKTLDLGSRIDSIASLVQIESRCSLAWLDLLCSESPRLALAALRSLQKYAGQDELVELLNLAHAKIMVQGESLARELKFVQHTISTSASPADTSVSNEENRAALREWLLSHASEGDPLLGRLAFRRGACSRCHLASDNSTLLGPRLNGVAKTNGLEYIVDSVLYPSRVIKTGFMVELVVTDEGKSIVGKVSEHGDQLTITTADGEQHQIAQEYVEERQQINQSLMPEALESSMSEAELLDLIAYLLEQ